MASGKFRSVRKRQLRGKQLRRVRRTWWTLVVSFGMLAFLMHWVEVKVRPVVSAASQAIAARAATDALNHALTEEVVAMADEKTLIHVQKDAEGRVEVAEFDLSAVTALQSAATDKAREELQQLAHETFQMPVGEALGGSLFASIGPRLPVRFTLMGTAHSSVETESRTAGMNQSVHVIYLDLTAQVNVLTPFTATPTTVHSKIPIAYVVFSGDVPGSYLYGTHP